ncbi:MAG: hypothetical protein R3F54_00440 [Alphaproteobacteria bacterium]
MNCHAQFKAHGRIVETCIIGTGGFGRSFLAQGRAVQGLAERVGVDVTSDVVAPAMRDVGIPEDQIRRCGTPAEAHDAWEAGASVAADRFETVAGLQVGGDWPYCTCRVTSSASRRPRVSSTRR